MDAKARGNTLPPARQANPFFSPPAIQYSSWYPRAGRYEGNPAKGPRGPRSKKCKSGSHAFDPVTGACRRKGCPATATRPMFGEGGMRPGETHQRGMFGIGPAGTNPYAYPPGHAYGGQSEEEVEAERARRQELLSSMDEIQGHQFNPGGREVGVRRRHGVYYPAGILEASNPLWSEKKGKPGWTKLYSRGVIPRSVKKAPHVKSLWAGIKKQYPGKKADQVFYAKLRKLWFSPELAARLPLPEPAKGKRRKKPAQTVLVRVGKRTVKIPLAAALAGGARFTQAVQAASRRRA